MSKKLFLLISVVLVVPSQVGCAFGCSGVIRQETPIIDGIKDPNWSVSAGYPITTVLAGSAPNDDADLSCSWWGMWDTDYFYVFVDVNDDSLWNDSPLSWEDDSIDFMIDFGNDDDQYSYGDDDYQYRICWDATTPTIEEYYHGVRSLFGVEYALVTKDGNIGYTVEIKFPWDTLDYSERGIASGDEMGFEVLVNDDDDGDTRDTQLSWCDITGWAWADPSLLGTVVLGPGRKACNPTPSDGAPGVIVDLLEWVAGIHAASHKVYFDPCENWVTIRSPLCDINGVSCVDPCYPVINLILDTTYYWAIDEVNETGPDPCFWPGDVWSFNAGCEFPICHPDYDEWLGVNQPPCWCCPRQCHGDADCLKEGSDKTGYYYCHFGDLGLLLMCWNTKEPPLGPGVAWPNPCICADFTHDQEGSTKTGYYRVHFNDLAILLANWNIKEPPHGLGIEPDCLDCP